MDSEILKGKPLTKEELKCLLELIGESKIITSNTTKVTNNTEEWVRITERFNATATSCPRTPQQLRLKWVNLKKNASKRSTRIRMNMTKTGGGPLDYIPPDDILDRVTSLLRMRKKLRMDESRSARNNAIANLYEAKKQCVYAKLININLENDNLKLKNIVLKLNNEKLKLETEKLKLDLGKLQKQQ